MDFTLFISFLVLYFKYLAFKLFCLYSLWADLLESRGRYHGNLDTQWEPSGYLNYFVYVLLSRERAVHAAPAAALYFMQIRMYDGKVTSHMCVNNFVHVNFLSTAPFTNFPYANF